MALIIRMALYFIFPLLTAYGFGSFDETTGNLTINADSTADTIVGLLGIAGFGATFGASRIAKAAGGET